MENTPPVENSKPKREILVDVGIEIKRVAIIEDGRLDDFILEVDRHLPILGNVYKGRVDSLMPSINGAFINIGQDRNGFLYLTDAVNPLVEEEISGPRKFLNKLLNRSPEKPPSAPVSKKDDLNPADLKKGQEVLVQVVKEPFGTKGARLTSHITLAGRFVVYMPYDNHLGISRKIDLPQERQRLKDILKEFNFIKTGGFIVRTVSSQQNKWDLIRDARYLVKIWQQILRFAETKQAPALIYQEVDFIWKIARDYLTDKVDKIIVNSYDDFMKLRKIVQNLIGRSMVNKIEFYKGQVPLFEMKNVSKELAKIFDKKVYLKSGAYIVIEPTEGLTVVDVNSGKFKTKASPEDAAFMVNMEAAPEIARQLRLRDLGGIIVIDFIDMSREGHKRKVLEELEKGLARDQSKTEVNRISPLGLVEMTRARTGKTIEAISFTDCPYCDGRGKVKIG